MLAAACSYLFYEIKGAPLVEVPECLACHLGEVCHEELGGRVEAEQHGVDAPNHRVAHHATYPALG
jgi:hypothetical protein